jgi:hypothetical protein
MTPRPPGKAAQAMQRLRDENAALRDLLAAVQETASTGERTRGEGRQRWFPAWWAAQRIAQWLDDTDGMEASLLAARAALFRGNAAEITALGEPAPADASACPSVSPDGDACTVEEPGHAWHYGPDEGGGVRRMWDDADAAAALAPGQPGAVAGDEAKDAADCQCIFSCADDPQTMCSLSGEFHVHPEWPCPVHPDAPGDRAATS